MHKPHIVENNWKAKEDYIGEITHVLLVIASFSRVLPNFNLNCYKIRSQINFEFNTL